MIMNQNQNDTEEDCLSSSSHEHQSSHAKSEFLAPHEASGMSIDSPGGLGEIGEQLYIEAGRHGWG
jgi:hypothetical protein